MADWSSIASQLSGLGASSSTMNVAMRGLQESTVPQPVPHFVPGQIPGERQQQQLLAGQMQALQALLLQQKREVDVATWDMTGLWLGPVCWMEVVRSGDEFSYEARNVLDVLFERGTLKPTPSSVELRAQSVGLGATSAQLAIINEDLLAPIHNGMIVGFIRRISMRRAKPYLP